MYTPRRPVYSPILRRAARHVLPVAYRGTTVACPCCDRTFRCFIKRFGNDALCPGCLSLRRHRLLWLFLEPLLAQLQGDLSLLHFAPEEGIVERLRDWPGIRYVTADIQAGSIAGRIMDITAIPLSDRSFDIVVCNHVLEHVDDDRAALRELLRVLKPAGTLVTMHPVDMSLARTIEVGGVTPGQRLDLYWQRDHVRRYGRDFVDRVASTGFDVEVHWHRATLGETASLHYGIDRDEPIFVCRRQSE